MDSVEWLFLNPEDVGYSDISWANAWDVIDAATASYPDFILGSSFWVSWNPPPVNWTNSGQLASLGGIWLDPNEYSTLQTTVHNDIMGMPGSPTQNPDLVGEVIVGWKFSGIVTPVPEAATMSFLAIGGLALIRRHGDGAAES